MTDKEIWDLAIMVLKENFDTIETNDDVEEYRYELDFIMAGIRAVDDRSYVPQAIALECLELLKPLDKKGEPNTLLALVKKAMKIVNGKRKK